MSVQGQVLKLRNRSINLSENAIPAMQDLTGSIVNNDVFIILHLKQIPSTNDHSEFQKNHIRLIEYLGQNSYLASINKDVLHILHELPFFHSCYAIHPDDRIHPDLEKMLYNSIETEAKHPVLLSWFEGIPSEEIRKSLSESAIEFESFSASMQNTTILATTSQIELLKKEAWVYWLAPMPPPLTPTNLPGKTNHRSNVLNKSINGRQLTGKDVRIGIWDVGQIGGHIDLANRVENRQSDFGLSNHSIHVAGTVGGAGILDPYFTGMAPQSKIYSWDYWGWVPNEIDEACFKDSILISQHSYIYSPAWDTCNKRGYYDMMSYLVDKVAQKHPQLTHVYSAGNTQSQCGNNGFRTVSSGQQAAKNAIVVGAVDYKDAMSGYSSWGPIRDGRLKPDICAVGSQVRSTLMNNEYSANWNGTSMACPGVTGSIAQLYELYRNLYAEYPMASTIKAIVCNTARDLGLPGPDFKHGFGRIDGLSAAECIEKGAFLYDSISHQTSFYDTIEVDSFCTELKISLCWSDEPTSAYKQVDSISLINHLDLKVADPALKTHYPFVLDPFHPDSQAYAGTDTLNNIEQVVISKPFKGNYVVEIRGTHIPSAYQTFSLSWQIKSEKIQGTYPIGYEHFEPGTTETIRWNASTKDQTFTIEFSSDSGQNWQFIDSNIHSNDRHYNWLVPAVYSDKCLIKISSGKRISVSEDCFSIMQRPEKPDIDACQGVVKLWWTALDSTYTYSVYKLVQGDWQFLANTQDSFYTYFQTSDLARDYFSIRAIDSNGVSSARSPAVFTHEPIHIELTSSADTVCFGQDVLFSASLSGGKVGDYYYKWPGFSSDSSQLIDSAILSRFYYLEAWDSCSLTPVRDSIFVFVRDPLSMKILASSDSICRGDTAYMTAIFRGGIDTSYTYYWGHSSIWQDTIAVSPDSTSTYYLYLYDSCSALPARDSIRIVVRDPLQMNLSLSNDTLCEQDELIIFANTRGGYPYSYQYQWDPGLSHSRKLQTFADTSAYYKLSLFDDCTPLGVHDSVFVFVQQMNANWDYSLNYMHIDLEAEDSSAISYKWFFGDGDSASGKNGSHTYSLEGEYRICLETSYRFGCKDSVCRSLLFEENAIADDDGELFTLYPNPGNGHFYLSNQGNSPLKAQYFIRSGLGKLIQEAKICLESGSTKSIDLSQQDPGLYIFEIHIEKAVFIHKLVIY
jgi:hypothetical protein